MSATVGHHFRTGIQENELIIKVSDRNKKLLNDITKGNQQILALDTSLS